LDQDDIQPGAGRCDGTTKAGQSAAKDSEVARQGFKTKGSRFGGR